MSDSMFVFDTKLRVNPINSPLAPSDGNASLVTRYLALLFDMFVLTTILFFVEVFFIAAFVQGSLEPSLGRVLGGHFTYWGIPALLMTFIFYAYFYLSFSASPGKLALNLKVVSAKTGYALSLPQIFLREIVGKFYSFLFFGLGFVLAFLREDQRALHDLIAGSRVVRDSSKIRREI